jgi:hypothetical protein
VATHHCANQSAIDRKKVNFLTEHAHQPIAARGGRRFGPTCPTAVGKQKARTMARCPLSTGVCVAPFPPQAPAQARVAHGSRIHAPARTPRPSRGAERIEHQRHLVEFSRSRSQLSAVASRANPRAPGAGAKDQVGVTGGRGRRWKPDGSWGRAVRCRSLRSSHSDGRWRVVDWWRGGCALTGTAAASPDVRPDPRSAPARQCPCHLARIASSRRGG